VKKNQNFVTNVTSNMYIKYHDIDQMDYKLTLTVTGYMWPIMLADNIDKTIVLVSRLQYCT